VPRHEITAVKRRALDALRRAGLGGEILGHIVARLAVFLRMAALTQALVEGLQIAVVAQKPSVVPQERARQRPLQILCLVTGRALCALPLLFVLVTLEAALHGRQRGLSGLDDAGVARHALPANARHRQMAIMIDRYLSVRALGRDGEAGKQIC
jgi:hypothetical protein